MVKFGRTYFLQVETSTEDTLNVLPPLTIEFDVNRTLLPSPNINQIRIYNLSANNRNKVRFDVSNHGTFRKIQLLAGYQGENLSTVFSGNISQAWSVREGVNFITQIQCYDAGFAFVNGLTDITFPAGTDQNTILETLVKSLPDVSLGQVGDYGGAIPRGNTYSGITADILRELTGGGFFVDNGKGHCLKDDECLTGSLQVITSESGLLNTPVREDAIIHFDMIFEPRLVIGQKVQLQSIGDVNFNGFYKVISLKHRGMISETVCGEAITSVGLWLGPNELKEVGPA